MSQILVVDDDDVIRDYLSSVLGKAGYSVQTAQNGNQAIFLLKESVFDIVFLDVRLPGKGGMDILQEIKSLWPDTEVVVITGHATIPLAVRALKIGASDYLEKPIKTDHLLVIADSIMQKKILEKESSNSKQQKSLIIEEMIGQSREMKSIRKIIDQSAASDTRIMILGENGTGKEMVARHFHAKSMRAGKSFIEVNCGAIHDKLLESELFGHEKGAFTGAVSQRKGRFEMADGGTLFLDEVTDMSTGAQAKVLRAVQESVFERLGGETSIEVDVRIISATNRDIRKLVQEGLFREDLFYRLNVIPVHIPPLRNRVEDIPDLINFFSRNIQSNMNIISQPDSDNSGDRAREPARGRQLEFTEEAWEYLRIHSWPGNIRELKNFVERITILSEEEIIGRDTVIYYLNDSSDPGSFSPFLSDYSGMSLQKARNSFEKTLIESRLKENDFNLNQTAESLGLQPNSMYGKLKKYGIRIRK